MRCCEGLDLLLEESLNALALRTLIPITARCPKCRRLWRENDEPDATLDPLRAEAVETFARRGCAETATGRKAPRGRTL
jgi:hypothetical protein